MDFIIITFVLKLAFVPNHSDLLYTNDYRHDLTNTTNYYYAEGQIKTTIFDFLFIQGIVNIPMFKVYDDFGFSPFNIASTFAMGVYYKFLEIGYNHYCIHPVIPYHYLGYQVRYEGSHNEFYIQIRSRE